jgi:hypothetical protein
VLAWREALEKAGIELTVWRIHRRIGMSGGLFINALLREIYKPYFDQRGADGETVSQHQFSGLDQLDGGCELEGCGPSQPLEPVWALDDTLIDQHYFWPARRLRRSVALQAKIGIKSLQERCRVTRFGA